MYISDAIDEWNSPLDPMATVVPKEFPVQGVFGRRIRIEF